MKKPMKILILLLLMLSSPVVGADENVLQRAGSDDGTLASSWLPELLSAKMGERPTMLMAKYEPADGSRYYIVNYAKRKKGFGAILTGFFEIKDNEVIVLGEAKKSFPFGGFIKDAQAVEGLWNDFLSRWIKQDGREGIQQKITARAGSQITEEEAFYLEQAGFQIPQDAQRVGAYGQAK